ncbi:DNA polymerase III subunit gamma/tau [Pleurocapsales cyanobacterium LEGE 06147]|nr:DNA polymerase III subunit gamma/tau [Pleurocapsales cyanobacterium LEGE 06147]
MSYEPLHHKYRPQTFADLVGQEAIATTLINAIKREKIAPAYLFTGPRGTGKTSSARILAKSLNCLENDRPTPNPCGKCEVCQAIARGTALDTIEIDAASNTGVDNIREIIERSRFAPVQCRYKVYVIDECHMLSTAAFNALLKTLEEPPEGVIFVLATTDPQRVLSTIISRCQRFDFRRIPLESMVSHLKYIATEEKLDITEEAIALVAQIANGGLRDAESLLDQLSLFPDTVTVEHVWDLVGAVPEQDLLALLRAIAANNPETVLQQCRHLLDRGREPIVVLQNLANFYLHLLIAKTAPHRPDLVAVTETTWQELCVEAQQWDIALILGGQQQLKEAETQLKNTTQPRLWLEVTLLGLLSGARLVQPSTSSATENNSLSPILSERKITPVRHTSSDNGEKSADSVKPAAVSTSVNSQPTPQQNKSPSPQPTSAPAQLAVASGANSAIASSSPIQAEEPQSVAAAPALRDRSYEELWEKVIEHLHPPTTQALLRQQCHLISLKNSLALVGISSPQLLRLHQRKVPNIEAAFAAVCQRKIQVKLEVATIKSQTTSKDSQRTQLEKSLPSPIEEEERSRQPVTDSSNQENDSEREILVEKEDENSDLSQLESPDSVPPAIVVEEITPNKSLGGAAAPTLRDRLPNTYSEEDLYKAVEMLAKNFEGEIVAMTGLTDEEEEVNNSTVTELDPNSQDSELPDLSMETHPKTVIRGRPDPNDYTDEDDIPFVRPVSLRTTEIDLQDCWESAANRPGIWLHGSIAILFEL